MTTECRHRGRDCFRILPGVQQCKCGQLFVFIARGNAGRYVRTEELTPEDIAGFSPEMEADLLRLTKRTGTTQ